MGLKCGIVGLPNVGKSTFFNALVGNNIANVGNYPFCTIDAQKCNVVINDNRLLELAKIENSQKIIPNFIEFMDIAGLIEGASKGEGLGNKFLANIREANTIIHILRCFVDKNITHVYNDINPIRDFKTIESELLLADLAIIENNLKKLKHLLSVGKKEHQARYDVLEYLRTLIENENIVAIHNLSLEQKKLIKDLNLLSTKKQIILANLKDNNLDQEWEHQINQIIKERKFYKLLTLNSKLESEIAKLNYQEKQEYMELYDIKELCLDKIIHQAFFSLGLASFFTVGPKEARSWTFKKGMNIVETAGIIHSDFQRGFIAADICKYNDFITFKGLKNIKVAGKLQQVGKDYLVEDGDIIHFKFNV